MGKRKTKSNKKQATRKKNHFGILGKNGAKRKSNGGNAGGNNTNIRMVCSLPKKTTALPLQNHNGQQQQEFSRQMNSLVERQKAAEASFKRKPSSRRHRKMNPKQQTNGVVLKPASFRLGKTTNQLVEETMHQMGKILGSSKNIIHAVTSHGTHNGSSSSLARAVAAIHPSEKTPVASNVQNRTISLQNTSGIAGLEWIGNVNTTKAATSNNINSFAALTTSDDSENEEDAEVAMANANVNNSMIRFAPATFSLGNTSDNTNKSRSPLPTKTPPCTPLTMPGGHHHKRHLDVNGTRRASLFGTINEEEIEELHYQQQTRGGDTTGGSTRKAATILGMAAGSGSYQHQGVVNDDVDDDL